MDQKDIVGAFLGKAQALKQEYDQVQGEATMESLRRFRRLVLFAIPLHFVLGWWFHAFRATADRPELQQWASGLSSIHTTMGSIVLLMALFVHWVLQPQGRAATGAVILQVFLCLAYLGFGVVTSIIDLGVSAPGGISSYITVCIALGVLSLMRPAISVPVYAGAFALFWVLLSATPINAAMLPSLVINSLSTTLLAMLASVMVWHQFARNVLLRRQLSGANQIQAVKQKELEFLSERDVLTGLYNRATFLRLAEVELIRTQRFPGDTALLILDLDAFMKLNDRHGHSAGDQVLREVARMLVNGVRSVDVVARMGGAKFVVLLPGTQAAGAMVSAEKLRIAFRMQQFQIGNEAVSVTASFGVSALDSQQFATLDALYAAADGALVTAKNTGRNRVAFAAVQGATGLSKFEKTRV